MEKWGLAGGEAVKDRETEQGTEEKQRREVASSAPDYSSDRTAFWWVGHGVWEGLGSALFLRHMANRGFKRVII